MWTLLLCTAALVLLTALGAGTLLMVAASSKQLDVCEEDAARREAPARTSFPDTLGRNGSLASLDRRGVASRPPGPVDEETDLLFCDGVPVAIEALHSHPASRGDRHG